jgi:hypothetical protein
MLDIPRYRWFRSPSPAHARNPVQTPSATGTESDAKPSNRATLGVHAVTRHNASHGTRYAAMCVRSCLRFRTVSVRLRLSPWCWTRRRKPRPSASTEHGTKPRRIPRPSLRATEQTGHTKPRPDSDSKHGTNRKTYGKPLRGMTSKIGHVPRRGIVLCNCGQRTKQLS